jgi:hypothetical protein
MERSGAAEAGDDLGVSGFIIRCASTAHFLFALADVLDTFAGVWVGT